MVVVPGIAYAESASSAATVVRADWLCTTDAQAMAKLIELGDAWHLRELVTEGGPMSDDDLVGRVVERFSSPDDSVLVEYYNVMDGLARQGLDPEDRASIKTPFAAVLEAISDATNDAGGKRSLNAAEIADAANKAVPKYYNALEATGTLDEAMADWTLLPDFSSTMDPSSGARIPESERHSILGSTLIEDSSSEYAISHALEWLGEAGYSIDDLNPNSRYFFWNVDPTSPYRIDTVGPTGPTYRSLFGASSDLGSGTGTSDLMVVSGMTGEYGGTDEKPYIDQDGNPTDESSGTNGPNDPNPYYNPDGNRDGLGDNLAFTVPVALNYVLASDGHLVGPSSAKVRNESTFPVWVSSLNVDAMDGWNIVHDANADKDKVGDETVSLADKENLVDFSVGMPADMLNGADYLEKSYVHVPKAWQMGAKYAEGEGGSVALSPSILKSLRGKSLSDGGYVAATVLLENGDSIPLYTGQSVPGDEELASGFTLGFDESVTGTELEDKYGSSVSGRIEGDDSEGYKIVFSDVSPSNGSSQAGFRVKGIYLVPGEADFDDDITLSTSGHMAKVEKDVTTRTKFGEIHWYVTAGLAN